MTIKNSSEKSMYVKKKQTNMHLSVYRFDFDKAIILFWYRMLWN